MENLKKLEAKIRQLEFENEMNKKTIKAMSFVIVSLFIGILTLAISSLYTL
jgi:hypothetical protein